MIPMTIGNYLDMDREKDKNDCDVGFYLVRTLDDSIGII